MGVGMSASLIAGIKTASIWLPERLTLATSLLIVATGIGGMFATVPLASLLEGRRLANAFHDSRRGNISSFVSSSTR